MTTKGHPGHSTVMSEGMTFGGCDYWYVTPDGHDWWTFTVRVGDKHYEGHAYNSRLGAEQEAQRMFNNFLVDRNRG